MRCHPHDVQDTSRNAYHEKKDKRRSQERKLFRIYKDHPEGLSDREVAEKMDLTCALASARRNGMAMKLKATEWELHLVKRDKDPSTHQTVNYWTVRLRTYKTEDQAKLF